MTRLDRSGSDKFTFDVLFAAALFLETIFIDRNPFTNPQIAASYETWYATIGHRAVAREQVLLKRLLARFPQARTILEPGCGTGFFTRWLGEQGLWSVGMDISPAMLNEAIRRGGGVYLRGNALMLPFQAKSFDLVALITALEFVSDPSTALEEASRIARLGLILGVLNTGSRLGRQYKRDGGPIYEAARLYTPLELERLILEVVGENARVFWRTTLWPFWPGALPFPNGGFIGMAVEFS